MENLSATALTPVPTPLHDQYRSNKMLHQRIVSAMQAGVFKADANDFPYAPALAPHLLRTIGMNNELTPLFIEQGFRYSSSGLQVRFANICSVEKKTVTIIMMRGRRQDTEGFEVFAVNQKSLTMASRVAANYKEAPEAPSLFPMEELIANDIVKFIQGDWQKEGLTLFLLWDTTGRSDILDDEEIKVYMGKPVSIGDDNKLIQFEWIEELGRFNPAPAPTIEVTPVDLPVAPAFEPTIALRADGDDESL